MEEPLPGDWWLTVRKDLEDLKLNLSLYEIRTMSKDKLKNLVNKAVESETFLFLLEKQSKSNKVKNILYGQLELQKHLSKPVLTIEQTKFLIAARAKMLYLRANYPNMQYEQFCPLCTSEGEKVLDTQEHLLFCKQLNSNCTDIIESQIKYEDIFSEDLEKQATTSIILENRFTMRKKWLKQQEISQDNKSIVTM